MINPKLTEIYHKTLLTTRIT